MPRFKKGSQEAKDYMAKVRAKKSPVIDEPIKPLLTPSLKEKWEQDIKDKEEMLGKANHPVYDPDKSLDKQEIIKDVVEAKERLEAIQPPEIKSIQKDKMKSRIVELEKQIKDGMPSKDEMMGEKVGKGRIARAGIVNQHLAWQEKNKEAVNEWKYLKRLLEPDDPMASNVETLRQGKNPIQKDMGNTKFFDMRNNPLGQQD